jgi:N-acetyltransferase
LTLFNACPTGAFFGEALAWAVRPHRIHQGRRPSSGSMETMRFRPPVELVGTRLRLVPLALEHASALAWAGRDPEIWRLLLAGPRTTRERMAAHIAELLALQAAGSDLPFTVLRADNGAPVGMTRFLAIDRPNRTVEVGGTWLDSAYWRTPFNTETKRLMLGHAFETEGARRVQLKTDLRNVRSQRAIERIGAVREGILREHLQLPDGFVRSSVMYSVLASEWPSVRARLDELLGRPWSGTAPVTPGETSVDASP